SLLADLVRKVRRLRRIGARLPLPRVAEALLRARGAALYHFAANVTRYYSVPLLIAGLLWPPLLIAAAVLLLTPPLADYYRLRRPRSRLHCRARGSEAPGTRRAAVFDTRRNPATGRRLRRCRVACQAHSDSTRAGMYRDRKMLRRSHWSAPPPAPSSHTRSLC